MTVGVPTFCGDRLTQARLARGLFKKSLSDMVGVSGQQITNYEQGNDKPQQVNLESLAEKLNFPVEFFLRPAWPESIDPIFWRSQAAESRLAREMTLQRGIWACEIFHFLEQDLDFPIYDLPTLELPRDFRLFTAETIERAALALRAHWGLRDWPIPDVTLALENAGIPVVHLDIPSDKQDGFCFFSQVLSRHFVGVNVAQISAVRARYDAAHELGHAVLHKHVTPEETRDPSLGKIIETQAHRFAGAFLFPRDAFLSDVRMPTLDYFCSLKRKWGISIAAMVYRAFDLGLIDSDERRSLYQNMSRRGWRGVLREPFDRAGEMQLETPRMLRRGVETVVSGGIFGRSTLLSAMALPESEIEQIAGLRSGYFRTADVVSLTVSPRDNTLRTLDLESGNIVEFQPRTRG